MSLSEGPGYLSSTFRTRMKSHPQYQFAYAVKDDYSNNDYSHQETRDGYAVQGEYRVLLPDGRTQIVTYTADENGYNAYYVTY
ncbi:unnamed protein product [Cyprideis torosa]|uniref:Uncharacterized protein n=1 Tax=Cyprideis torosa TaxID=163714 RepID=A0A7R8WA62_9CRUS|nr:unnamed protein product [Cyprideis torosa]CAG0890625.1 unnamed protein product [Cyprideis torosa]